MPSRVNFRPQLETTGAPELESIERRVQEQLDRVGQHADTLSDGSYTAGDSSDWDSPAPTTIADALDRLASLARTLNGGTPVP